MVGLVFGSFPAFWTTLIVALAASVHGGSIRPKPIPRRQPPRRRNPR
jgi:hypothetical protein